MSKVYFPALVAPLAISVLLPATALAGFFGDHPRYDHAMSDLRTARSFLFQPDAPNVTADENGAVREIDAALGEIKRAAQDDWKETSVLPNIDTHLGHKGRLEEALKLLDRAHKDISQEEDDKHARGLQAHAIVHLDNAIGFVKTAMQDKHLDDQMYRHF